MADNRPVLQDDEVRKRLLAHDRSAGLSPIFQEKVKFPEGFLDNLLDGSDKQSFKQWNLIRRCRKNILSVLIDRTNGVIIEQAQSAKDVKRVSGQCKDLLYGSEQDCEQAWSGVDRRAVQIKIDVRQPYVSSVSGATLV